MKRTASGARKDDEWGGGEEEDEEAGESKTLDGVTWVDVPLLSEPLQDPQLCEVARKDFNRWWGCPATTAHNPCPKPVSISCEDLPRLASVPFAVADKSDGQRYQLLLGTWPDFYGGQPYGLLVDEMCRFFEVTTCGSEDFYKGSLLDGELVQWEATEDEGGEATQRHRKAFLAFDAVAVAGERVANLDFYSRLRAAIGCVGDEGAVGGGKTCYRQGPMDGKTRASILARADWESANVRKALAQSKVVCMEEGLIFSAKTTLWPLSSMVDRASDPRFRVPYPTDGLILTAVEDAVRFGRNASMLKVKFEHTVDLRAVCGDESRPDGFYFQDGEWEAPARLLALDGNPIQFLLEPGIPPFPPGTSDIWECRARFDGWYSVYLCPLLLRDKKPSPNDRATVERTLRSVSENILPEHLYDLARRHSNVCDVPPLEASPPLTHHTTHDAHAAHSDPAFSAPNHRASDHPSTEYHPPSNFWDGLSSS